MPTDTTRAHAAWRSILASFTDARDQVISRLAGLGDEEYLWEPVPDCWTVRPTADGFVADFVPGDPQPAPFTTIAWRLWHMSVDCMDSYTDRAFGTRSCELAGTQFVGSAAAAVRVAETAIDHFAAAMQSLGDAVWKQLGPKWGPYADATYIDLTLHAHHELTHHGAEIGVLRDLWRSADPERSSSRRDQPIERDGQTET